MHAKIDRVLHFRHPHTHLHDLDDGAHDAGGGALGVVPPGDDAVEELAALADLHDEVHGVRVLERLAQAHHVGVGRHRPHDGHLPPHVLHVHAAAELALADGLARQQLAGGRVGAPPGHAELAAPQLLADRVPPEKLLGAGVGGEAFTQHGDGAPPVGGVGFGDGGDGGAGPHVGAAEAAPAIRAPTAAVAGAPLARQRPGHTAVAHRRSTTLRRPDGADDLSLPLPLSREREEERDGGEWRCGAWLNLRDREPLLSPGPFVIVLPFLGRYAPSFHTCFYLIKEMYQCVYGFMVYILYT
jgi:hypothetical protein